MRTSVDNAHQLPPANIAATSGEPGSASLIDAGELMAALPAAVYTTDAEGRITFYNRAAAQLWGCHPQLGTSVFCGAWKLYWPDGRPMPHDQCPMAEVLKTGRPMWGGEAIAERPDGTHVPFIPYPTPLYDANGRLIGAINILLDITQRKMLEQTVHSQARQSQILNVVAKAISSDLEVGRVAQAVTDTAVEVGGAQFAAFYHYAADMPLEASSLARTLCPAALEEFETAPCRGLLDATLRDGAVVRSGDIRSDPRFGGTAPFCLLAGQLVEVASYLAVPVRRPGKILGALLLGHAQPGMFTQETEDLISGVAAHAAIAIDNAHLYGAERRLGAIVESSTDAIVSKDINGIVTSWNGGAERLFGYTAEEMIGRSIRVVIPADRQDEEDMILRRIRRGERVKPYETVRARKDGTFVDISLALSPICDAEGRIIGASKIARDITARKQAQARQELLAREIHHRTKNLFAVVHAVVSRSFAGKRTVEEAEEAVLNRLQSLAQMHVMLLDKAWQGADLGDLVRSELSPYTGRVTIEGPPLMLNPQAAQNFALALHELATNAAKYGALSDRAGQVSITWSVSPASDRRRFLFRWEEHAGPLVSVPTRRGFGSTVLEQVMSEYFDIPPRIEFLPAGIKYELSGPVEAITAAAAR